MFQPSALQSAIFQNIYSGSGNLLIEAVAGSGKSTTLIQGLQYAKGSAIFLAFGKDIAAENKRKLPAHVLSKTFHSLCYSPVMRSRGLRDIEENKLRLICRDFMDFTHQKLYAGFACKLVGLARQNGIGVLVPDDYREWRDLAEWHNLELESNKASLETAIAHARKLLKLSIEAPACDYDDLLYLTVLEDLRLPTYDWVLVDEAQDLNAVQRAIVRKLMHRGSRAIFVGDRAQAIYGFRGADSDSLDIIKKEFDCQSLPLSISYRCSQEVVLFAQQYMPDIQPSETAPEGCVDDVDVWRHTDFGPDDLIVCRNAKPLVQLGYQLLSLRIPCRILGRDIGASLISLIEKMNTGLIDELMERLQTYREKEIEKARTQENEALEQAIIDRTDAIFCIIEGMPVDECTVADVLEVLRKLFDEKGEGKIKLATIHKAKGLEAYTVWWLNKSLCPSKYARKPWQMVQERNLCYVATTRAIHTLNMIEMGE